MVGDDGNFFFFEGRESRRCLLSIQFFQSAGNWGENVDQGKQQQRQLEEQTVAGLRTECASSCGHHIVVVL